MTKRAIVVFLATLFVGVTLFLIPFCSKRVLSVPNDANHARVYQEKEPVVKPEECFVCHGPKGVKPIPDTHAAKDQCLFCHTLKRIF